MVGDSEFASVRSTRPAAAPSGVEARRVGGIDRHAQTRADGVEERPHDRHRAHRPLDRVQCGDGAGEGRDGVVRLPPRAVAGGAAGGERHPGRAALAGADAVEVAAVGQPGQAAPGLTDGRGDTLEQVAVLVGEEARRRGRRCPPRRRRRRARRRGAGRNPARPTSSRPPASRRPCPSCPGRPGPRGSRRGSRAANGSTDQSDASAGTTSRWPCTSRPGADRSRPAMRTTVLARRGADSSTTGSRPASDSCVATHSAASRSPRLSPAP